MDDLRDKEDVAGLIRSFYEKATVDPVIGHFFTTVVQLNWEKHIPLITNFWYTLLFGGGSYSGNPMDAHIKLNQLSKIEKVHFDTWVKLWTETVTENFAGPKADEAVLRADSIAQIMSLKLR